MKLKIFQQVTVNTATSTSASTASINIPKIIHFIWAGGAFRIPRDNLIVILQWGIKNRDWKIFIWIDSQTDPKLAENDHYKKTCRKLLNDEEVFKSLEQSIKETLLQQISIQDIAGQAFDREQSSSSSATNSTSIYAADMASSTNTMNFRDEYVAYEIDKLRPNYGASSDVLRYGIKYQYGGAYFDSDVHSGATPLSSIPLTNLARHILYFEHYSQFHTIADEKLANFDALGSVGNDAFICSQHNPLMLRMLQKAQGNYKCEDDLERVEVAYGGRNIRHVTVKRTGPGVIADLVADSKFDKDFRMLDGVELRRMRDGKMQLSVPAEVNDKNWLKVRVTKKEHNAALTAVANTIEFEAKHFNVIRIDDHINDMLAATHDILDAGNEDFREANKKVIVIAVIAEAEKYIKKDTLLQITGLFPQAAKHFSNQNTLFALKDDLLKKALDELMRPEFFEIGFSRRAVEALGDRVTVSIQFMEENLRYIESILNNFERFSSDQSKIVTAKLTGYVGNYLSFVDVLIDKKIESDKMTVIKQRLSSYSAQLDELKNTAKTPMKTLK
jgi:hypothetical protein